ncbi:uncharacterized protein LOC127876598 isoform X2 [Dreissena polymorpha]|uniref:Uncharacterized protein n=2 Tax=Dreissena polymorpha TaxID=45954 RepID=A0A9D4H5U8_DREPO|nr:uncharacterized protein LOC127876598 isoform X2 [Dreissena polymorpha]KAH3830064.1 hypothetical protein DPMN_103301 [Dreissena polymorpha]
MITPPSLYEIARIVCMQVLLEEHHAAQRIEHTEIEETDDVVLVETLGSEDNCHDNESMNNIQFRSSSCEFIVVNHELPDMFCDKSEVNSQETDKPSYHPRESTGVEDSFGTLQNQTLSDVKQSGNCFEDRELVTDKDKDIDEIDAKLPKNQDLNENDFENDKQRHIEQLKKLMKLSNLYYVTRLLETNCFTAISGEILSRILKYCPSKLTDRLLLALVPPHATELHLQKCESLTLTGVVQVLHKCRHIHVVNLSETPNVTCADLFEYMGIYGFPLTTLILEQNDVIDDHCVHRILGSLPLLTTLNVSSCSAITDNVFLLHEYNQRKKEVIPHPAADIMTAASPYSLTSVDISGCRQLTNDAVKHLVSLAGPQLRHVDISFTSIDCIALLYLGGYSFPAVIDLIITNDLFKKDPDLRNFRNACLELCEVYNQQYADLYDNDLQTDEEKIRSHQNQSGLGEEETKVHKVKSDMGRDYENQISLLKNDKTVKENGDEQRRANRNLSSSSEDDSKIGDDEDDNDENEGQNELEDEDHDSFGAVESEIDEIDDEDDSDEREEEQESFDEIADNMQQSDSMDDLNVESESHSFEALESNFEDCLEMLEGCLIESDSNIDVNEMDRILDLVAKDNADFYETSVVHEPLMKSFKVSQEHCSLISEEDVTKDTICDENQKKIMGIQEPFAEAADETDEIIDETFNAVGYKGISSQYVSDSLNGLEHDVMQGMETKYIDKADIIGSNCGMCYQIRQQVTQQQQDVTMPLQDTSKCSQLYEDSGIDVDSKETDGSWSSIFVPENDDLNVIQIEMNQETCFEDCGVRLLKSPSKEEEEVAHPILADSESANKLYMEDCLCKSKPDLLAGDETNKFDKQVNSSDGYMNASACDVDAEIGNCYEDFTLKTETKVTGASTKSVNVSKTAEDINFENSVNNVENTAVNTDNFETIPFQCQKQIESCQVQQLPADSDTLRTLEPLADGSAENTSYSACKTEKPSVKSHHTDMAQKCHFSYAEKLFKPQIITLNVSGIKFLSRQSELGQLCLEKFLQANSTLEKLSVAWKGLTIEWFKRVLCHLDKLRTVELVECTMLQSAGVAALGRCCTQLQSVNLRGVVFITDSALVPYLTQRNLSRLLIAESQNISDRILGLISCRLADTLTHLDLSWCEDISEKGINNICMKCSNLKCLYLKKCPISDSTLQLLAENARDIEELSVEVSDLKEDMLTDSGLIVLSENLTKLRILDISWNLSVTDLGLYAILKNCALLEEANLRGLKQITIAPLMHMIDSYADLKASSLGNLEPLPQRSRVFAPNLRVLDLDYSDLVNDQLLQMIVNVCRGTLNVTDYYGTKMVPDSE